MAAARPLVSVQSIEAKSDKKSEQLALPHVLLAPIRSDIVHFVHTNMAKNRRQAYAVSEKAGHQHSAESWGTGRAVARVPRVSGGGTSRAGQGAFANMCRKGRMYSPTKTWRRWHRKINLNQKRYAVASALAATAVPALVLARGHRVETTPEIPLVLDTAVESLQKTKAAIAALKAVGAYADVEKARDSRKIRRGVGKMRNRRHSARRGPLVVFNEDHGITQAFRNLPGVELANVARLNLLQLAPGGHLGRFIIWTRAAFDRLNFIYGSVRRSAGAKAGYTLPRNIINNSDLTRLINSDEVQSKVRPSIKTITRATRKKNPLNNLGALVKLNPYALTTRRSEIVAERRRAAAKEAARAKTRGTVPAAVAKFIAQQATAAKKADALARTHEPQQVQNYQRLIQGEGYVAPVDEKKQPKKLTVVQKPREKNLAFPKKKAEKKKKAKKVKKVEVKEEKKSAFVEEVKPQKREKIAIKIRKAVEARVKGDKEAAKKGAAPKAEAGKAEAGKKEAGKAEAKKEDAKKDAGKKK